MAQAQTCQEVHKGASQKVLDQAYDYFVSEPISLHRVGLINTADGGLLNLMSKPNEMQFLVKDGLKSLSPNEITNLHQILSNGTESPFLHYTALWNKVRETLNKNLSSRPKALLALKNEILIRLPEIGTRFRELAEIKGQGQWDGQVMIWKNDGQSTQSTFLSYNHESQMVLVLIDGKKTELNAGDFYGQFQETEIRRLRFPSPPLWYAGKTSEYPHEIIWQIKSQTRSDFYQQVKIFSPHRPHVRSGPYSADFVSDPREQAKALPFMQKIGFELDSDGVLTVPDVPRINQGTRALGLPRLAVFHHRKEIPDLLFARQLAGGILPIGVGLWRIHDITAHLAERLAFSRLSISKILKSDLEFWLKIYDHPAFQGTRLQDLAYHFIADSNFNFDNLGLGSYLFGAHPYTSQSSKETLNLTIDHLAQLWKVSALDQARMLLKGLQGSGGSFVYHAKAIIRSPQTALGKEIYELPIKLTEQQLETFRQLVSEAPHIPFDSSQLRSELISPEFLGLFAVPLHPYR